LLGSTLKLIAVVVPLGLDTLGVALALGIAGLPARQRTRIALLFAAFEAAMPLIGVALGAPLGHALGSAADYLAAGVVAALGLYMLVSGHEDDDGARILSMTQRGVAGAVALGLSISMDELAIGFGAGLLRLPLLAMVIAIAVQAFVVTQIGMRLGARLAAWHESAERIAGVALIALGAVLLTLRLVS
jgi:manganese efflux pump family protein